VMIEEEKVIDCFKSFGLDAVDIKELPIRKDEGHIYFLMENDKIVYIGKSISGVGARVNRHATKKNYDRIYYMFVDIAKLDSIEKHLIAKINPKYNGLGEEKTPYRKNCSIQRVKVEDLVVLKELSPKWCTTYRAKIAWILDRYQRLIKKK